MSPTATSPLDPFHTPPPANSVLLRDAGQAGWLFFRQPRAVVAATAAEQVLPALREVERRVDEEGLLAAGFVAYEAAPAFNPSLAVRPDGRFPLLWFGLYGAVERLDRLPETAVAAGEMADWQPSIDQETYRRRLQQIKRHIARGETYQVNFTYRLRAPFAGDAWAAFRRLIGDAPPPYAAFVDTGRWAIASASPELFFRLDGDQIQSRPMKGTAARGLWFEDDCAQAAALAASTKEQAENVMIVDMVRNDLGQIAAVGSVAVPELFTIEQYPTVWQMTSTVRARTNATLADIFRALFPPASITGAPKRRTMAIIADLESLPRRIYTGAIGWIMPGRQAQFNVAIRTLLIDRPAGAAEYGVGGGIVWDSVIANEALESQIKARILRRPPPPSFDLLETILWTPDGGYFLLARHLRRLLRSASYFGFSLDAARVRRELRQLAGRLAVQPQPHRVRLLAARAGGLALSTSPLWGGPPDDGPRPFADLPLAREPVDPANPFLYHKTTQREPYEAALAGRPGATDVLLFNERGELTESTIANVAVALEGVLWTPPLRCGLLPGVYREWLLANGRLRERPLTLADLEGDPPLYLFNSVRGMGQVRRLTLPEPGSPGWASPEDNTSAIRSRHG